MGQRPSLSGRLPGPPMVLTSHVEGKGGPCQGPAPKQPQNQQGGKAGNQGLTGPQARGQYQGAHKDSPAAKPGGQQGTHIDSIRRTQGRAVRVGGKGQHLTSHSPGPGGHSPATSPGGGPPAPGVTSSHPHTRGSSVGDTSYPSASQDPPLPLPLEFPECQGGKDHRGVAPMPPWAGLLPLSPAITLPQAGPKASPEPPLPSTLQEPLPEQVVGPCSLFFPGQGPLTSALQLPAYPVPSP